MSKARKENRRKHQKSLRKRRGHRGRAERKAQSPAKSRKQKQKKANDKKTTNNRKQGRKEESERDAEDVVVEEEEDDDEFEARNHNYVNRIAKFLYDDGKWYKLRILKFKKSKRAHECIYLQDKSRQDLFIDACV